MRILKQLACSITALFSPDYWEAYFRERRLKKLLNKHGGIQTCPWCKQCAQSSPGWFFEPWVENPLFDKLTCGVCGGESIFIFDICMRLMGPLSHPEYGKVESTYETTGTKPRSPKE